MISIHNLNDQNRCGLSIRDLYDRPIPRPPSELLDRLMATLESRLVTKRLRKDDRPHPRHERDQSPGRDFRTGESLLLVQDLPKTLLNNR